MQQRGFAIRTNGFLGFVFLVAVLVGLFFLARGLFTILSWAAPVLIIGAAIIHFPTITGYLRFMWNLLRRNPLMGIVGVLLSVVGFPILSGVLFGKAILDRKVKKLRQGNPRFQPEREEYADFEEIIRKEDRQNLELPPLEKKERAPDNPYKDFF
jgi:hypothetical protein